MNIWENAVITNKGIALQAKLHSGTTLSLTRAVTGAGTVEPNYLAVQTQVTTEMQELSFSTQSYPEEGKCAVPLRLTNADLEEGYTVKQIGVYAFDPDEGEILYMIAQTTDGEGNIGPGTTVPSSTEMAGYVAVWTLYIQYGQADGISVTVDPANAVTIEEAQTLIQQHNAAAAPHNGILVSQSAFTAHTGSTNNPHNVTAEQLGLGNVDNTKDSEKLVSFASEAGTARQVKYGVIIRFNGGRTEGTNMWTFDGSTSRSVNITPAGIGAAAASHGHSYNDLSDKPTSLPANGGNADTVDGKHASDFATAGHTHNDLTLTQQLAAGIMVLSSKQYGDTLPAAGTKGRIFFKKV